MLSRQQKYLMMLLIAGSVVQAGLLLASSIPLGVPGEWTWSRVPAGTVPVFNLGCTVVVLLIYYAFVRWGTSCIESCSRLQKGALLFALCLASMTVLWNLKAVPSQIFGHAGMSWVTYYPRMSGYFTQAVSEKESTAQFLANYEQTAREGDYLHQGTHPPGLILYFRFLHHLCKSSPALTQAVIACETEDVAAGLDILEELSDAGDHSFTPQQRATLWLSLLVTLLVSGATVLPIYFFLSRFTSPVIAFSFSGLWPLVPAVSLFAPKSDILLAFFSAFVVCLWARAVVSRKSLFGFFAGCVLWTGMLTSLAVIVTAVIMSFWTILYTVREFLDRKKENEKLLNSIPLLPLLGILAGLLLPSLLMWGLFDLNLSSVWLINLSKHAEFYEHNSRTFYLWLFVNPLEMAFSLGMPLFLLVIVAGFRAVQDRFRSTTSLFSLAVIGVWLLLLLSGKNMGEAARLWIFLLPLMLSTAAFAGDTLSKDKTPDIEAFPRSLWTALFITQSIVALATLSTVDAFDFTSV